MRGLELDNLKNKNTRLKQFANLILFSIVSFSSGTLTGAEADIHRIRALEMAGSDMLHFYTQRCNDNSVTAFEAPISSPVKIFDNYIFLGLETWNASALLTSEGIVIFDPLETRFEAEEYIVNGLRELGYEPEQIKHIIVMHGHGDHFGGAKYLQELSGADVYMSEIDWEFAETDWAVNGPRKPGQELPDRDKLIENGMTLTLGDTTIEFYMTPGHTPGTVSALIPLKDGNNEHLGGYWGGSAFSPTRNDLNQYQNSLRRFSAIAEEAGVDVILGNHPANDMSITRQYLLAQRDNENSHPYVVGADDFLRMLGIYESCLMSIQAAFNQ